MKVIPGDWLTNAGIIGYLRICELADRRPDYSRGSFEIKSQDLTNFTESYFTAILMLQAERIFRFRSKVFKELEENLDKRQLYEFRKKFDSLGNTFFRKIEINYNEFRRTLKSVIRIAKSYKKESAHLLSKELDKSNYGIDVKDIVRIKKKLNDTFSKDIKRLEDKRLNFVYVYLQTFYRNKNVIGNPSLGKIGRKKAFHDFYVKPAMDQLKDSARTHEHSEGFLCRFCKQIRVMPKEFYDVNSIFAEGMFSTTAIPISFKNFFYNLQPDLFVCKVCQLLILCAWAGFTPIPWRFRDAVVNTDHIFVSLPSLTLLWKENKKIQQLYNQSGEKVQETIYEDIVRDIFLRSYKTKTRWVIENILFVEIMTTARKHEKRPNFRYFHIGQDIANLFINEHAINAFRHINGRLEASKNLVIYLRRNVITRILEYDSLFPLCYLLLSTFLRNEDSYHLSNLFNILVISCIRRSIVDKVSKGEYPHMLDSGTIFGILAGIQEEGGSFKDIMDYDERKRKSYVLLSMIRNNRVEDFYHVILQIYMSKNKPIPSSLIGLLNAEDQIGFHAKAYAFMSGFLNN